MRSGLIGLVLAVMLAGPAAAAETVTTIPGAPGPGPSKYDKVFVTKFGPKSAKRVLVLMPGYYGGAGDFTLDAREIVKRVPGLQVWALDRRSQALEDTVALRRRPRRAHQRPAGLRLLPRLARRTRRSSRTSSRSIRRSSASPSSGACR